MSGRPRKLFVLSGEHRRDFSVGYPLTRLRERHGGVDLRFGGAAEHGQTEKLLTYVACAAAFDENVERTVGRLLAWSDGIVAVIHKEELGGARWERSRAELRV